MKLNIKISIILIICILLSNISIKASENKIIYEEPKEITKDILETTVGPMNLPAIDPILNPAEDNNLSRIISKR